MRSATLGLLVTLILASGCGIQPRHSAAVSPTFTSTPAAIARLTCGEGPSFDASLIAARGAAEREDDPAAVALRRHLADGMEADFLPDHGWIEVNRSASEVEYVAQGPEGSWMSVSAAQQGGRWTIVGWGGCDLRPELPPGTNPAVFRVAPGEHLTPETRELDVLVMEMACASGQDARGRILEPTILTSAENIIVVMAVRSLPGSRECPGHPETPYVLQLPEPLGDRTLLDGADVPPRDARECADGVC